MSNFPSGLLIDQPLLGECDPFWLHAQDVVRRQVRAYVKRKRLSKADHGLLLDALGLS